MKERTHIPITIPTSERIIPVHTQQAEVLVPTGISHEQWLAGYHVYKNALDRNAITITSFFAITALTLPAPVEVRESLRDSRLVPHFRNLLYQKQSEFISGAPKDETIDMLLTLGCDLQLLASKEALPPSIFTDDFLENLKDVFAKRSFGIYDYVDMQFLKNIIRLRILYPTKTNQELGLPEELYTTIANNTPTGGYESRAWLRLLCPEKEHAPYTRDKQIEVQAVINEYTAVHVEERAMQLTFAEAILITDTVAISDGHIVLQNTTTRETHSKTVPMVRKF